MDNQELSTPSVVPPRFEFTSGKFMNERARCLEIPRSVCAICCRLLYDTERRPMKPNVEQALVSFLNSKGMRWPVMYYRNKDGEPIQSAHADFQGRRVKGMAQGPPVSSVVVCPCHGSSGKNSVKVLKDLVRTGIEPVKSI